MSLYKVLQTVMVCIISLLTIIATVILQIMATAGGAAMSSEMSETVLVLAYALSAAWLYYLTMALTILLLASIWQDEIIDVAKWIYQKIVFTRKAVREKLDRDGQELMK